MHKCKFWNAFFSDPFRAHPSKPSWKHVDGQAGGEITFKVTQLAAVPPSLSFCFLNTDFAFFHIVPLRAYKSHFFLSPDSLSNLIFWETLNFIQELWKILMYFLGVGVPLLKKWGATHFNMKYELHGSHYLLRVILLCQKPWTVGAGFTSLWVTLSKVSSYLNALASNDNLLWESDSNNTAL